LRAFAIDSNCAIFAAALHASENSLAFLLVVGVRFATRA